jgi:hypothetical protein
VFDIPAQLATAPSLRLEGDTDSWEWELDTEKATTPPPAWEWSASVPETVPPDDTFNITVTAENVGDGPGTFRGAVNFSYPMSRPKGFDIVLDPGGSDEATVSASSELPHPTALGATRPSVVEGGASCFCVGTCIRGGHSGSRLHRRLPFTGGSECPTPTGLTLGHNRHCALLVALEQCRRRGERHTTTFDHVGSKAWPRSESYPMTALYPLPTALLVRLRGLRCSLREGA